MKLSSGTMEDFPRKLADSLERIASTVRSLTVERAEKAVRVVALAIPVAVLGIVAVVFVFMTIHGVLAIPLGDAGAFAVVGGLFLIGSLLAWAKRTQQAEDSE